LSATDILAATEAVANEDLRKAKSYRIHHAGAEYALCNAMSQLMGAVLGVLRESLTDTLKGFVKIRSAFKALESIIESEQAFLKTQSRDEEQDSIHGSDLMSKHLDGLSKSSFIQGLTCVTDCFYCYFP
jgi:hypothetical protein